MNDFSCRIQRVLVACLALLSCTSSGLLAQTWGASSATQRAGVVLERAAMQEASWTDGLDLRNVGPSVMSGRVVDVAVVADTMYVAYATGGLWKSVNHGTTFEPLLDATCTLGSVAAHPSGRVVVGSGEVNSSRSSYAGDGVYVSDDHGRTWRHAGLEGSHHVGRVILDSSNPDRMWVAALGELYSTNRGGAVYRSEDAGQSWEAVLTVPGSGKDEVVGFVDLVADDNDPNHLFAASWDRTRRAHNFTESGFGTGIWETLDGGDTWQRISSRTGFPEGEDAGRIGLTYHSTSATLYALLDNQAARPESEGQTPSDTLLQAEQFLAMDADEFLQLPRARLQEFLDREGFDEADSAAIVQARVRDGELAPRALFDYLTDGNRALFETEISGAELYVYRVPQRDAASGGASSTLSQLANGRAQVETGVWRRTHDEPLDDVCYTYGYYFGLVTVDPSDASTVYIAGVPLLKSTNGGETFESVGAPNVHVDHHKLWVNPTNPNHLINGNDGGINVSWDGGVSWIKCNSPSVGQFYAVEVDDAEPYRIYGGLQDNGTWVGNHRHEESPRWHQTGHHGFESLSGGDGMQIEVDTRGNEVVYTGYQFGWYMRTDRESGETTDLHPKHTLGETPLRWNWQTPILLSKHQQDVFYMASNRVHRSLNRGDDFEAISGDLTRGSKAGNVPFGTLTTLAEHPRHFGRLAVGSDDGLVHVTLDGGHSWDQLDMPVSTLVGKGADRRHLWVSEVAWSHHDENLLVVSLNGYRHDCLDAFVFATRDLGKNWENWGKHLPHEPVNALVECKDRAGWWVVGTDGGAYFTVDGGSTFSNLHADLPRVPVHDLVIQERQNDLVLGTHGRGIYVLDLSPLLEREGNPELWKDDALTFEEAYLEVERSERWGERGWAWSEPWEPTVDAWVWAGSESKANLQLRFIPNAPAAPDSTAITGGGASVFLDQLKEVRGFAVDAGAVDLVAGLQKLEIPLRHGEEFLEPGTYTVVLVTLPKEGPGVEATTTLTVTEAD
ncbi:MAG: glycosyl hydrolase [Flavobacteriales bacterium]